MSKRYRLKLSRLDFVSLVDDPAQPNAKTLLIKRKGAEVEGETHARFVKTNDELGLAFFWAFTSTNPDGSEHFDHHGDTIDQGFVKAALDFMLDAGGAVDEMHAGEPTDARVAFAMPMTPDIAEAFSLETKQSGLMVALKVTDEQLAKLKDGTYTGVSIAGLGVREPIVARKSGEPAPVNAGAREPAPIDPAASKSTRSGAERNVAPATKEKNMDELQQLKDQIAALASELASVKEHLGAAKADAELTDEEKAHAASLAGESAKRFKALGQDARKAEVAKAKDGAIVIDGQTFLKGTQAYSLACKVKEQADAIEKAAVRKLAAETIGKLAGDDDVHDAIIAAIRSSGASDELVGKMLNTLRGANSVMASKGVAGGAGGEIDPAPANPQGDLDALVAKHMADHKVSKAAATDAVLNTTEGARLYGAVVKNLRK